MKKVAILLVSSLLVVLIACQDHNLEPSPNDPPSNGLAWKAGGPNSSIQDFAVDRNGNSFISGTFRGTAHFGHITITKPDQETHTFIAKYNATGEAQWVRMVESNRSANIFGVAVDGNGNLYATGGFNGSATFDGTTLTGEGFYLVKYTSSGDVLWVRQVSSPHSVFNASPAFGIEADESGFVYLTGLFEGTVLFGDIPLTATSSEIKIGGREDAFIAKLNTDGVFLWVRKVGGAQIDVGNSVAVDKAGNVYASGYSTSHPARFGDIQFYFSNDSYATKFATDGTLQWATGVRRNSPARGDKITVDEAGNSFVKSGNVISWLNSSGVVQWNRQLGNASIYDIAASADGGVYITGSFEGTLNVEGLTLTSSGGTDVFLAKLNRSGGLVWMKREGGRQNDYGIRVDPGARGELYVTGTFNSTTTLAGTSLSSAGNSEIFIVRYDQ
ncbi:SBBP repeat-containing protein [Telluribacter sp. SYSU D00476]|uniref:SBBP repeat-containing protein n=1 Tax=Telluribacter sp. SYSU D00476 TaxID=2811430 RepID=UPI001FF2AFF2|nr:SBBP repeat-containing protein [Telluribacter sp. SYSU D00476]